MKIRLLKLLSIGVFLFFFFCFLIYRYSTNEIIGRGAVTSSQQYIGNLPDTSNEKTNILKTDSMQMGLTLFGMKYIGPIKFMDQNTITRSITQIQSSAQVYQTVTVAQLRNEGKVEFDEGLICEAELPCNGKGCFCKYTIQFGEGRDSKPTDVSVQWQSNNEVIARYRFRKGKLDHFSGFVSSIKKNADLYIRETGKPLSFWLREPNDPEKVIVISFDSDGFIENEGLYQIDHNYK